VFRRGFGPAPEKVEFVPFYGEFKRPYVVYWDLLTDAEWKEKESAHRAEAERAERLRARTLDTVHFDSESEKAHGVKASGPRPRGDSGW
jgi:hypothetical protein